MSTRPDDDQVEDRTILPSANTPEPEYEPGDLIANPQAITPRPGGSRVNPHGVRRSTGQLSAPSGDTGPAQEQHFPPRQAMGVRHWHPQSADSGPRPGQNLTRREPMSTIGIYGSGITLLAVILAFVAPFAPFLSMASSISLWGASTGSANSYVILGAGVLGLAGGIIMLTSFSRPKCGFVGGILSMVAGAVIGGVTAYLLTNSDHRALIAQGGSFGVAAWLLIAATGALLIGGILGAVRGAMTT